MLVEPNLYKKATTPNMFDIVTLEPTLVVQGTPSTTTYRYTFPANQIDTYLSVFNSEYSEYFTDIRVYFDHQSVEGSCQGTVHQYLHRILRDDDDSLSGGPMSLSLLSPIFRAMGTIPASLAPRFTLEFTYNTYTGTHDNQAGLLYLWIPKAQKASSGRLDILATDPTPFQRAFDPVSGFETLRANVLSSQALGVILFTDKDDGTNNNPTFYSGDYQYSITYGGLTYKEPQNMIQYHFPGSLGARSGWSLSGYASWGSVLGVPIHRPLGGVAPLVIVRETAWPVDTTDVYVLTQKTIEWDPTGFRIM